MNFLRTLILISLTILFPFYNVSAEEAESSSGGDAAAQANNPLADLTAFNIQNYYIGKLTELEGNDNANQLWLRYATPISFTGEDTWITRASLPVNSFPAPPDGSTEDGLGDFNLFSAYLFDTGNPAVSFGIGPQVTAPSATDDALGSNQWSGGLANVLFNASSSVFQYGYLLTWQHGLGASSNDPEVNLGALQPFTFFQLGDGLYLRGAPIWLYDFEDDGYSIPLGLGIGKVVKDGDTVYNFFVEPQYSVADDGAGYPEWQVLFALNMQFY